MAVSDNPKVVSPDSRNVGVSLDGFFEDTCGLVSAFLRKEERAASAKREVRTVRLLALVGAYTLTEEFLRLLQITIVPSLFGLCDYLEGTHSVFLGSTNDLKSHMPSFNIKIRYSGQMAVEERT